MSFQKAVSLNGLRFLFIFGALMLTVLACRKASAPVGGSLEDCTYLEPRVTRVSRGGLEGVDLVVVVDNSPSMAEEQEILATGVFSLINMLSVPLRIDPDWSYPAVDNIRVAVVTSDMGLQWGDGEVGESDPPFDGCSWRGDDGAFQAMSPDVHAVRLHDNAIKCEPDRDQCPDGFTCTDGFCVSSDGTGAVSCEPQIEQSFAETDLFEENPYLVTQAACLTQQGTTGCGVEQTLEAGVRGLQNNPEFMHPDHLLAVLVISDEDDCSILDSGLFETESWNSTPEADGAIGDACGFPASNEPFLSPVIDYYDRLIHLKDDQAWAVVFAALVGVPDGDDSPCQGTGDELVANQCLDDATMQVQVETRTDEEGAPFDRLTPACTRTEGDAEVASATPGRRYVELAQTFGERGYIGSVCNADWTPALKNVAEILARQGGSTCYHRPLDWSPLPEDEQAALGCDNCGVSSCDAVVELVRTGDEIDDETCPDELYEGLSPAEAEAYRARSSVEAEEYDGEISWKTVLCPLPKLPAPQSCDEAFDYLRDYEDVSRWYYCETDGEDFNDACRDGLDNDDDGITDCDDSTCHDCTVCGGTGDDCGQGCRYFPGITAPAVRGLFGFMRLQCLEQGRLSAAKCVDAEDSKLGARCRQEGLDEDGLYYADLPRISFRKGCDCLSHLELIGFDETGNPLNQFNHFCTRPCTRGCPSGFSCESVFNGVYALPEGVSRSYCVPTCLVNPCDKIEPDGNGEFIRQQCRPSSDTAGDWRCRWPE